MTNERKHQLLQAILEGKEKPQSDLQGYLVNIVINKRLNLSTLEARCNNLAQQLRAAQDEVQQVIGAHNQAYSDLIETVKDSQSITEAT